MGAVGTLGDLQVLETLLQNELKPLVKKIDVEAYYPRDFLIQLGKSGFFQSEKLTPAEVALREVKVVEETAKVCMTTAFNIWCHLASLTYIRQCDNDFLKTKLLPQLENGELLGATGLSNPMKYYAGLETLHLRAERVDGGFIVNGTLPAVSNLDERHWFGVIAEVNEQERVMLYINGQTPRLKMKEKLGYLGLNGSATYTCAFNDVFIPNDWVISEKADTFVQTIRPTFVLYQIPLGLGVTAASIQCIEKVANKQGGCNQYVLIQPDELKGELEKLQLAAYKLTEKKDAANEWKSFIELRLQVVNMTSKAVHTAMIHQGSGGYLQHSAPSRRLRESYFLVSLTPTVRHLEKMLYMVGQQQESSKPC